MKKLLIVSMIVVGTFASAGVASASSIYTSGYAGWATDALNGGNN